MVSFQHERQGRLAGLDFVYLENDRGALGQWIAGISQLLHYGAQFVLFYFGPGGVMARVFISHASEDREWAAQLHQGLTAEGHEVFLDQDPRDGIRLGDDWDARLHQRLREADAVVCLVSKAAVSSTWCTAEIAIAMSRGSRLLPVRAEPGLNHPLLKSSIQYAERTEAPKALVEALRRIDVEVGQGWPDDRSPFPGLRPLEAEHHRAFFGRKSDVERLAKLPTPSVRWP